MRIKSPWARPKGMHNATRERLLSMIWDYEEPRDAALSIHLHALMRRDPTLRTDPKLRGMVSRLTHSSSLLSEGRSPFSASCEYVQLEVHPKLQGLDR